MTTSKKWLTICVAAGLIAACSLAAPPTAGAAITETKNSVDFDWKYEMQENGPYGSIDVKPSDQDLDENGTWDFHEDGNGGTASVLDGILTIDCSKSKKRSFISDADAEIWRNQGFTYQNGYTFEARFKIISQAPDVSDGTISLHAVPAESNQRSYINLWEDKITWGTSTQTTLDTNDNTDDFHVIRVAQEPTTVTGAEVFSVWRDGVLLADDLGGVYYSSFLNRMFFGDVGSSGGGEAEIDYVRFISGAYAPGDTLPPIPGDANLDRVVNDEDASILAAHWQQSGEGIDWGDGDFNDDGIVNDKDASILAAHWHQTGEGSTAPIPEPGTLALLAGALLSLLVWRRR